MPLSPFLNTNPSSTNPINFGLVPVGSSADITIHLSVISGGTSWAENTGFLGPSYSVVSDTGHTPGTIVVRFSPSAPGVVTGKLIIHGFFSNSPITFNFTGNGSVGGFLTLMPQTTNDFGPVKDGTPSSPLNVLASNHSGTDVTVSAIAFNGDFTAGPGQPAVPFTLHANNVDPPVAISVIFTPSVTGFRVTANAVVVTSSATNSPTNQAMQGTGVIITPAFSLPLQPQAVLIAFVDPATGLPTVLRMDSTDLDCEEPASFSRVYDWATPLQEKYLGRVIFRYEDESAMPFDLTCTAVLTRVPVTVTKSLINVGGVNDGLVYNAFFDLQQTDDLIQIVISRAADDGPVVITEMFHEIDPRGEFIPA